LFDAEALRLSLQDGTVDADDVTEEEEPILAYAARMGAADSVAVLLDAGADPYQEGPYGRALDAAIVSGNVGPARLLLDRGLAPGTTPEGSSFNIAIEKGDMAMVELVLEYGVLDLNEEDEATGATPLITAIRALPPLDAALLVNLLVNAGADVDFASGEQRITPLMAAAETGSGVLVLTVFSAGANPEKQDANGDSARAYAATDEAAEALESITARRRRVRVERLRDD